MMSNEMAIEALRDEWVSGDKKAVVSQLAIMLSQEKAVYYTAVLLTLLSQSERAGLLLALKEAAGL